MDKISVQCIRTLDWIRDQHVINFKYVSYLYHIQCIKSWIQAKSLPKYPNQILLVLLIWEVSFQIFCTDMEIFWQLGFMTPTHRKKTTLQNPTFFQYLWNSPSPAQNVHEKDYSPQVAHSKSTTKNWKTKISLYLSLSLFQLPTLKLHHHSNPKKERKKENHKLFQPNKTDPLQVFIFFTSQKCTFWADIVLYL